MRISRQLEESETQLALMFEAEQCASEERLTASRRVNSFLRRPGAVSGLTEPEVKSITLMRSMGITVKEIW